LNIAKAVLFVICLNLAAWIVVETNLTGSEGLTPMNPVAGAEEIKQQTMGLVASNPANLVSLMMGYVWPALQLVWRIFSWAFFGLPTLLIMLHAPAVLSYPLTFIWFAVWAIWLAEFVRGMKMSD